MARDAASCPGCGRFFSAVKCPRCGFSAPASSFKAGCPVCGYSQPPVPAEASLGRRDQPEGGPAAPLPVWVWLAALAALAAAIAALVSSTLR